MNDFENLANYMVNDNPETPLIAYRLAHAVAMYNKRNPDRSPATYDVYADKRDAEPPISCHDAGPGEIYTRIVLPEGNYEEIQAIEIELIRIENPETFN